MTNTLLIENRLITVIIIKVAGKLIGSYSLYAFTVSFRSETIRKTQKKMGKKTGGYTIRFIYQDINIKPRMTSYILYIKNNITHQIS